MSDEIKMKQPCCLLLYPSFAYFITAAKAGSVKAHLPCSKGNIRTNMFDVEDAAGCEKFSLFLYVCLNIVDVVLLDFTSCRLIGVHRLVETCYLNLHG
jgi:hypothetical protein